MGFNTDMEDATVESSAWGVPLPLSAFVVELPDFAASPDQSHNSQAEGSQSESLDLNSFVVAVAPEGQNGKKDGALWRGGQPNNVGLAGGGKKHEKRVRWAEPPACGCAPEYREPLGRESKAIVGGREHCVGGWCRYELDRREGGWRYSGRRPATNYPGRSYIGAADVVESVGGAGRGAAALRRAAEAAAISLGRLEDALCDPSGEGLWECLPPSVLSANPARRRDAKAAALLTIPRVTSTDVENFSKTGLQDPEAITGIVEDIESVTASLGPRESDSGAVPPPLPPLRDTTDRTGAAFALDWRPPPLASRFVEIGDDEGVLRLEAATAPYLDALEELQAAAASRLGQAAKTISDALDARA